MTTLHVLGLGFLALSQAATDLVSLKKWGYKATTPDVDGPEDWHLAYPDCGGLHQSPINFPLHNISLTKQWDVATPPLEFGGACEKVTVKKLHDLYQWDIHPDENCTAKSINHNEREHSFLQFHMHMTSEHTIENEHYDAELHFVHTAVDGSDQLLVLGVFLQAVTNPPPNGFIQNLLGDMENAQATELNQKTINYADLLNSLVHKSHLLNYSGSLTTPGCSETVDWWVLLDPIAITFADFQRMRTLYGELPATNNASNNRPIQPLNDREIVYYDRRLPKECSS